MPEIVPNLWFDTQALEAAEFYTSVFPNSRITAVSHYPETGNVMAVDFELDGQRHVGINGGPQFTFTEAVSLEIVCDTQDEIDHYWEKLSDGGEEGKCGWLKDRYGLSWQVTPRFLIDVVSGEDRERTRRTMEAMYKMRKLDVEALRRAADGVAAA